MQEHYFLFAIAFIYTVFATIQDLKQREVANWLSFSLIAFSLAYRAFFSIQTKNVYFLIFGLIGFAMMFLLGNAFYYLKAFAGGDAKLLMGFGIILPYQSYMQAILFPILLVFLLFLSGAIYSLIYSGFIAVKNKEKIKAEFCKFPKLKKTFVTITTALVPILFIAGFYNAFFFPLAIVSLLPIAFAYTKSLEKCMIFLLPPEKLTEGDWLEKEIKINSRTVIKKSVHGLSYRDIQILKKYKKSAWIKQGIPFVPAFLITLIITVLFFLTSKLPAQLSFLF